MSLIRNGLLLLLALAWTGAAAAEKPALTAQDRADIARIETYLNGLTTVRSGFLQVAPDGSTAQGQLYVSRPGKLRVEYDPPVKMLMVATGIWFIYYDGELGETTYLPMRSTPVSILLKDEIKLDRDANIIGLERAPGALRLAITDLEDPDGSQGILELTFSESPMRLRRWVVKDLEGRSTTLALLNPQFGVDIAAERFLYVSPNADDTDSMR